MDQPKLTRDLLQNRQAVLGFIFALTRDPLAAEEVFQEVALAILAEANSGKLVEPFLPWAREVARRRVAEHFRKAAGRREGHVALDESLIEVVCRSFDENEEAPETDSLRLNFLRQCIQKLSGRSRRAIELRYQVRMSIDKIADALAWQIPSVNVLLTRTRKTLAECIRSKLSTV